MKHDFCWYSHSGSLTFDNWDYCGVTTSDDFNVYILADGTTDSSKGGALAKTLIHCLISEFLLTKIIPSKTNLMEMLKQIHNKIRLTFLNDSASYVIAIFGQEGQLITVHAGDCLLGKVVSDKEIQWLLTPHTLANATNSVVHEVLAKDPFRNTLTKSFRGRRFLMPEYNSITIKPTDKIIMASDGFWADLSINQQLELIYGGFEPKNSLDDISFLLLSNGMNCNGNFCTSANNIYCQGMDARIQNEKKGRHHG